MFHILYTIYHKCLRTSSTVLTPATCKGHGEMGSQDKVQSLKFRVEKLKPPSESIPHSMKCPGNREKVFFLLLLIRQLINTEI